jgi:ferredoxin
MRIAVDRERCASAGMCALTVPDVFDQDDEDGRVILRQPEPPAIHKEAARRAVALCPSGAITTGAITIGAITIGADSSGASNDSGPSDSAPSDSADDGSSRS